MQKNEAETQACPVGYYKAFYAIDPQIKENNDDTYDPIYMSLLFLIFFLSMMCYFRGLIVKLKLSGYVKYSAMRHAPFKTKPSGTLNKGMTRILILRL